MFVVDEMVDVVDVEEKNCTRGRMASYEGRYCEGATRVPLATEKKEQKDVIVTWKQVCLRGLFPIRQERGCIPLYHMGNKDDCRAITAGDGHLKRTIGVL